MSPANDDSFLRRAVQAIAVAVLCIVLLYFLREVAQTLLLLFAGLLLAIFLGGLANVLEGRTPLPRGLALAVILVLLTAATGLFFWLAGPRLAAQLGELTERIPASLEQLRTQAPKWPWAQDIVSEVNPEAMFASVRSRLWGAVMTTFGGLTNVVVIAFVGIYVAINPSLYASGLVRLVPISKRERAGEVLDALGHALRRWLVGRFSSMAIVGVLTTVSLAIAGIPLALTLGVIAALFSFVPYIGPVAAVIPAALVAYIEGPTEVLTVGAIYLGVQLLESYIVTPLIQQRAVSLAPALLISVQVVLGVLAGLLGVAVATPLLVALVVLIQMLYVEDVLGDDIDIMGSAH